MVQVSDGVELIRRSHRRDDPGRFRVDRACHCAQPKLLIVRVRGVKGEQVGIRRDGTSVGDGASWCFWSDAFLALDHLRPGPRVAPKVTRVVLPAVRRGIGFVEGNWRLCTAAHPWTAKAAERERVRALLRLRKATSPTAHSRIELRFFCCTPDVAHPLARRPCRAIVFVTLECISIAAPCAEHAVCGSKTGR
jgi:hypothetical protein